MIILTGFQNQAKLESDLIIIQCSKDNSLHISAYEFKFYQEVQKETLGAQLSFKTQIAFKKNDAEV